MISSLSMQTFLGLGFLEFTRLSILLKAGEKSSFQELILQTSILIRNTAQAKVVHPPSPLKLSKTMVLTPSLLLLLTAAGLISQAAAQTTYACPGDVGKTITT